MRAFSLSLSLDSVWIARSAQSPLRAHTQPGHTTTTSAMLASATAQGCVVRASPRGRQVHLNVVCAAKQKQQQQQKVEYGANW